MNGSTGEKVVCGGGRLAGCESAGGGLYCARRAFCVARASRNSATLFKSPPATGGCHTSARPSLTRLVMGGQRGSITLQIGLHELRPRRDSLDSLVACLRYCGQFSFRINFLSSIGERCDVRARLSRRTERSRVKTAPTQSHGPPRVAASKYRRT